MRMDNNSENFEQLQRLLAIKKHELPPPGYFNRFSGEVIARIREERHASSNALSRLQSEAPWLVRLWQALESKPAFAGAFGAAVCALLLGGIFFAEKPVAPPEFASPVAAQQNAPFIAASPTGSSAGLTQPVLLTSTNPAAGTSQTLFDLIQPGQTAPVSFDPVRR